MGLEFNDTVGSLLSSFPDGAEGNVNMEMLTWENLPWKDLFVGSEIGIQEWLLGKVIIL